MGVGFKMFVFLQMFLGVIQFYAYAYKSILFWCFSNKMKYNKARTNSLDCLFKWKKYLWMCCWQRLLMKKGKDVSCYSCYKEIIV